MPAYPSLPTIEAVRGKVASPAMKQGLTSRQLFMMSFGAIVGVGWITVLGRWLELAGPGGSVIALAAGAVAVSVVAGNYGFLAGRERLRHGGEIQAVGETLGAGAGFAVAAALALACTSIVAFEAVSAGWILTTLFPALEGPVIYRVFERDVHAGTAAIALGGTALMALANLRPVGRTARSQNAVVLVKIGVTVVFVGAAAFAGQAEHLRPLLPPSGPERSALGGVLALAATMPLWYAGFNVVAQLAGERDASVAAATIGRMMRLSILAACIFYVCVVVAAASVVPWPSLVAAPLPAATAFRIGLSSPLLANLVLLSGLLGIVSAWIACFAAATRVLDRLRRQLGGAGAGGSDEPGIAPARARTATLAIALVAGAMSLAGRAALVPIVNVAALCFGLVYLAMCLAAWRHAEALRDRLRAATGAAVAAFMAGSVVFSALAEGGWRAPEMTVVLSWTALVAVLWLSRSKDEKHAIGIE